MLAMARSMADTRALDGERHLSGCASLGGAVLGEVARTFQLEEDPAWMAWCHGARGNSFAAVAAGVGASGIVGVGRRIFSGKTTKWFICKILYRD